MALRILTAVSVMKSPNESRGMGSGVLLRCALSLAFLFMLQPGLVASSGGKALHKGNYQEAIADDVVWLVEFQSGRCGTCRDFAPIWSKLVDAVGGKARFGVVDIDGAAGMELAKDLDALEDGIPSVRMLRAPGDR